MNLIEKLGGYDEAKKLLRMFGILRTEFIDGVYKKDLQDAIADHEKCQHEWNETTSNGDVYRFFVCKHCDSTQNYVPFKDDNPSHFDHCTDIRNHISPLTGVIER